MHEGAARKMAAAAAGQSVASGQTAHGEPVDALAHGKRAATTPGLEFPRFFSTAGVDPFDQVEWELRDAVIGSEKGQIVFEQRQVEMPKTWSQQATNIVVSKYFRGHIGSPDRERSVKQLIGRVVDTIGSWARKQKYFASEEALSAFSGDLKHLLVEQKAAFNSPVPRVRCRS
jgi:ribonucleoside-diphosphate reductase alpha chain